MGGLYKKVSQSEPCPVCGKPDWCFWKPRTDNPDLYNLYCNRSSEAKGTIVAGNDGNEYVAIFENDSSTVFEEKKQREERQKKRVDGEVKEHTPRQFTVVDSVSILSNEELDKVYRCILDKLPLYRFHADYLIKEGWNMELIKKHHICSFPVKNLENLPGSLRKGMMSRRKLAKLVKDELGLSSLAGVPGAYIDKSGYWSFTGKSGILFPVYDANGNIVRLRIRMDYLDLPVKAEEDENGFFYKEKDTDERVTVSMSGPFILKDGKKIFKKFSSHAGKYRNFSSYKINDQAYKDGFIENMYQKGCEAGNQMTVVADRQDDFRLFWITEGEKKAIFSNYVLKQPFVGLPGVNDFGRLVKPHLNGKSVLDIFKQRGAKVAVVAYDADRYSNDAVMNNQEKLALLLKKAGFTVLIADWDQEDGKGLDDLLSSGKVPAFYEF